MDWNHALGSAPANIIVRKLMVIEPIELGFRTFKIHSKPGDLNSVSLKVPTIRGIIKTEWRRNQNGEKSDIVIPANTEAIVYLNSSDISKIIVDEDSISKHPNVRFLRNEVIYVVLEVDSGMYSFKIGN